MKTRLREKAAMLKTIYHHKLNVELLLNSNIVTMCSLSVCNRIATTIYYTVKLRKEKYRDVSKYLCLRFVENSYRRCHACISVHRVHISLIKQTNATFENATVKQRGANKARLMLSQTEKSWFPVCVH